MFDDFYIHYIEPYFTIVNTVFYQCNELFVKLKNKHELNYIIMILCKYDFNFYKPYYWNNNIKK